MYDTREEIDSAISHWLRYPPVHCLPEKPVLNVAEAGYPRYPVLTLRETVAKIDFAAAGEESDACQS